MFFCPGWLKMIYVISDKWVKTKRRCWLSIM